MNAAKRYPHTQEGIQKDLDDHQKRINELEKKSEDVKKAWEALLKVLDRIPKSLMAEQGPSAVEEAKLEEKTWYWDPENLG
jgi:archaellum component FlaC